MPFPAFFILAAALGAKEGIADRRDRKTTLDLEAERINAINNIDLGLDAQGVSNQFDARQIEAMQRQFQTAQGMLRSKDPKLQALGAGMIGKLDSAIRANIQQNETEARADVARLQDQEIVETGLTLADNEKRFARSLKMNEQLNNELRPFGDSTLAFNKVMNLLDNDDQLASLAGLTAFVQSIDDSVVREAELLKYQGANGLITQLVNLVNKSEGRDFDPATKQSVRNASAALMNAQKTQAVTIANSYQARATSFALDVPSVMSGIDENLFTPIPIDRTTQDARQAEADAAEAQFDRQPSTFEEIQQEVFGVDIPGTDKRLTFNPAENIASRLIKPFLDISAAIGRVLRGAKLLQKADGTLWIQELDGTLNPVTNQDYLDLQKEAGLRLTPGIQKRFDARSGITIEDTSPIERRP